MTLALRPQKIWWDVGVEVGQGEGHHSRRAMVAEVAETECVLPALHSSGFSASSHQLLAGPRIRRDYLDICLLF